MNMTGHVPVGPTGIYHSKHSRLTRAVTRLAQQSPVLNAGLVAPGLCQQQALVTNFGAALHPGSVASPEIWSR